MIIAPSILSLHYDNFKNEIKILNENVEYLHFDVMDGHFVPNLSFGPAIQKTFRQNSNLFLDTHLMVDEPEKFIEPFVKAGSDGITFHYEAYNDIIRCDNLLDLIHSYNIKAGISIKPMTNVESIMPILDKTDLVLVMSVEPGFGGQEFIPSAYDKIKTLKTYRANHNCKYLIEVDGGVNDKNAHELIKSGCDILVAGSFIFKGDMKQNIEALRRCE